MKHTSIWKYAVLPILCILMMLTMASCSADADVDRNDELGRQFMDHVLTDDYEAAYDMVKNTVSDTNFHEFWTMIQAIAEDAERYEIEQTGWNINYSNGVSSCTTAYQVYLDNGRIVLFRVVTCDDIEGIAGIHFSDVTDFLHDTEAFVPAVQVVLGVVSLLALGFCIWMLVDCLRRKMRYKVLWAILIFFGVAITVTTGQISGINFMVGLMIHANSIVADPGLLAIVTKVAIPVGAILYCCLRKRFTVTPNLPFEGAEASVTVEMNPVPASDMYTPEESEGEK